jgi:hypothetical protein
MKTHPYFSVNLSDSKIGNLVASRIENKFPQTISRQKNLSKFPKLNFPDFLSNEKNVMPKNFNIQNVGAVAVKVFSGYLIGFAILMADGSMFSNRQVKQY